MWEMKDSYENGKEYLRIIPKTDGQQWSMKECIYGIAWTAHISMGTKDIDKEPTSENAARRARMEYEARIT